MKSIKRVTPALSSRHKNANSISGASKRPREAEEPKGPYKEELEYQKGMSQTLAVESGNAKLRKEIMDLEKSILSFYYRHQICYETRPDHSVARENSVSTPTTKGQEVLHFPRGDEMFTEKRYQYYAQSELAELKLSLEQCYAAFSKTERQKTEEIENMEREVEEEIYNGSLVEQRTLTASVEAEVATVRGQLEEAKALVRAAEEQLKALDEKEKSIEEEKKNCLERTKVLEEKKRKQMENVNQIREERETLRKETAEVVEECQRRQNAVEALRREIERVSKRIPGGRGKASKPGTIELEN